MRGRTLLQIRTDCDCKDITGRRIADYGEGLGVGLGRHLASVLGFICWHPSIPLGTRYSCTAGHKMLILTSNIPFFLKNPEDLGTNVVFWCNSSHLSHTTCIGTQKDVINILCRSSDKADETSEDSKDQRDSR
jgi:hypothetical protein